MKLLLLLSCIWSFTMYGQESITLSGKVIDNESGSPVEFASVGLKNSTISTVTNLKGHFRLNIPRDLSKDSLFISSIGYNVQKLAINDLVLPDHLIIKLTQSETILDGVVVSDQLTANEIMQLALERMPVNHPDFPISMQAFYRERQQVDGKYVSLVEAAVTAYDPNNFKRKTHPFPKVRVDQLRRSITYNHPYNSWWQKDNLMLYAWDLSPIPYSRSDLSKKIRKMVFSRLGKTVIHGQETYIVKTDTSEYWTSTFFIQAGTYAFVRVEENYDHSINGGKTSQIMGDSILLDIEFKQRHTEVDFKEFNGRYYPSYIKLDANHDYLHNGEKLIHFRIAQDIIINNIEIETPEVIKRNDASKISKSLLEKDYAYDEEFWKTFNVIQETPLETQLIEDLEERALSLIDQFISNQNDTNK